ncbi:putative kinetochore-like protein [Vairimorpha necatrix]|uniref:Protein yippee-like n=1 Tax=Vairimorpha necatrix TaxID=6039 RepID=A0AAX4JE33_9MICR
MCAKMMKNPFTVNCRGCNLPLTDSFSLLEYKNKFLIHSSISTNLVIDKKKINEGDSAYMVMKCKCHMVVGRRFISTSVEYNGYSGMYFINKEDVFTYNLGAGVVEGANLTSMSDICEDIDKIQKLCLYLYKKIDGKK